MSVPYDYDQTNVEHLRAVIAEQEATIEYLREMCKKEETENAKLWELIRLTAEYLSQDRCEGCICKRACDSGELDMCWIARKLMDTMCELGVSNVDVP